MFVRTPLDRRGLRTGLLIGASLFGLASTGAAHAQGLASLRAAAGITTAPRGLPNGPTSANPLSQAQQSALARSLANQAIARQRINLARQTQAAAIRSAVRPNVPNGLVPGGLVPVGNLSEGVADQGFNTWVGAERPTETRTGDAASVLVKQTQQRAVLSWESFNVGANTTLTFEQKQNGADQRDWVALNRVVGRIDPNTGRPDLTSQVNPATILGKISAPGQVLILSRGGVLFGPGAQVNTHSLLVSSLEIGRGLATGSQRALTVRERNEEFITYGLLGFRDQAPADEVGRAFTLSPLIDPEISAAFGREGAVTFDVGAELTVGDGGFLIAVAPQVVNRGVLTATNGQVSLHGGRQIFLQRSEGTATSASPFIRGLIVQDQSPADDESSVYNAPDAIISSRRGYASLSATARGAVLQEGIIESSTSVARNGYVGITAGNIRLGGSSLILVNPDEGAETIPQSADSVNTFKTSQIVIGNALSRIEFADETMLLAPSADVQIGAPDGLAGDVATNSSGNQSRIFVDSGAILDVGGIKDFVVSASRNLIAISPVKGNELRDTPLYRASFLNGATVFVDPRISGVRADGVRWVGSPLIEVGSYYAQIGVTASELMTEGGNIGMGLPGFIGTDLTQAPDVIVKAGATIDVTGGWRRFEAGQIQTTRLITRGGAIVDISQADPLGDYVGIAAGYTANLPRTGFSQTAYSPIITGTRFAEAYSEGRDAGSLTIKASAIAFDGRLFGQAFAGDQQITRADSGTAAASLYGDIRNLQASPFELPAGAYLNIQALSTNEAAIATGGADIRIGVASSVTPLADDLAFGQSFSFDESGALVVPDRDGATLLGEDRRNTIQLSEAMLDASGVGQINLQTSGSITLDDGVTLDLGQGGAFTGIAARTITLGGDIEAAGGTIAFTTIQLQGGSVFEDDPLAPGAVDIIVNGTLSTRGRWVNDFNKFVNLGGSAYVDGGSISLRTAPRVAVAIEGNPNERLDISGSILINEGALLDVSSGGYVASDGTIDTSGRGGDVSLINETAYFQLNATPAPFQQVEGNIPGIRVTNNPNPGLAVNPSQINARILIADGAVRGHGFAGGGTFALTTPAIQFGDGPVTTGTALPLDFFSDAGFADYQITSYATELLANRFVNTLGGFNAILSTQELVVGAGETLRLTQSRFAPFFTLDQQVALQALGTGGDLRTVLTPSIQDSPFDQLGLNLSFGGLIEFHVAEGGRVVGGRGAGLSASKFWNEGAVRLVGGTITQTETLLNLYSGALGAREFADFFTENADGSITEPAASEINPARTNANVAVSPIYLLGSLGANEGIRLSAGSVTDLSGASLRNPRVTPVVGYSGLVDGVVLAGGTIRTASALENVDDILSRPDIGEGVYTSSVLTFVGRTTGRRFTAEAASTLDLRGAADSYDILTYTGLFGRTFQRTPVWSASGTLALGAGGTIADANVLAGGVVTRALGGTLVWLDPTLVEAYDVTQPIAMDVVSAADIEDAGFDTLVAQGGVSGLGDVSLSLGRAFILTSQPNDNSLATTGYTPTVSATGALSIVAPYISVDSFQQFLTQPATGVPGTGSVTFSAENIDIRGAVLFDRTISEVTLAATDDLRLIGAVPIEQRLGIPSQVANSLLGQLVVNGNLTLSAAQLYPTTGSTFLVASTADEGLIRIASPGGAAPDAPYSAGARLLVQAANIRQQGIVRVPLGELRLGSTTALVGAAGQPFAPAGGRFAPATLSVVLAPGSISSVSADGLSIPYGTTTDQIEYFFTPTTADPLTAPPAGVLRIAGTSVALEDGSVIDVRGGGDTFAYEFIPGTGGSRDVLDRFNTDPFSSNDGFQFPDGRQIYAIVPGLSDNDVAAFDPLFSADYSALYGPSQAGRQVYLTGVPDLAPGWYTLLPARYAVLPGGFRIYEETGADPALNVSSTLRDGTFMSTGFYGFNDGARSDSTPRLFTVQNEATFRAYSNIVLTSGTETFRARAVRNDVIAPRLPIDAGRIILEPLEELLLDATVRSAAAEDGRGALADISGNAFAIVADEAQVTPEGVIELTVAGLESLNVQSLFIGGTRSQNADGATALAIRAGSITVDNGGGTIIDDAGVERTIAGDALNLPELLLAVDGSGSAITLADGAAIIAEGQLSDDDATDYVVSGAGSAMTGQGSVLRVANGAERFVTRTNVDAVTAAPVIAIGDARLNGTSVLIGSTGNVSIDAAANVRATALTLDAVEVSFAPEAGTLTGLVITPALETAFGQAERLTIRSVNAIAFADGAYRFGNVTFDSAGFAALGDGIGNVQIVAESLRLANAAGTLGACGAAGAPVCGGGTLDISAGTLSFGSGTVRTYGFGDAVNIAADDGMTYDGVGGLDVAGAALTLDTPFVADAAIPLLPGEEATLPSLTLTTAGAVTISGTPGATVPAGTPGANLAIRGATIAVTGSRLRATAGKLDLVASGDLTIGAGAIVETPAYSKQFGDDADAYRVSAPGGRLALTSTGGDVVVADGALLNLGGDTGKAGLLVLSAAEGEVTLDGTVDASAPDGGASLSLDTGGSFDLDAFAGDPRGFTGHIAIHTGTGDLALGEDVTLTAESVLLAADAGLVTVAGTIDTSGVEGGDVSLFGRDGVNLAATARIDASADGYGAADSRQASAGDVILGTDGTGVIDVAAGARIDVRALRPGDRLVPVLRNGVVFYSYVAGDAGGTVTLRAPIIEQAGADDVNVTYAGTIEGARQIALEGYRRWDLADVAADGRFVGVTIRADGTAVLNTGTGAADENNFLSGRDPGTVVDFIQGYDVSAAYAALNGLADADTFVARPGIELVHSGAILLDSNWNFAAADVDVAGAIAAGVMRNSTLLPGEVVVNAGREADLLANFANFRYRVGGEALGAAGALSLRAGGDLTINGSINDGMFVFGDQTDPDYLARVTGAGTQDLTVLVGAICPSGAGVNCGSSPTYSNTTTPTASQTVQLNFNTITLQRRSTGGAATPLPNDIPFNAEANSAAAVTTGPNGGDPLGSAEYFPLLGDGEVIGSWAYQMAAGASLDGPRGPSIDPMHVEAGNGATFALTGSRTYTYGGSVTQLAGIRSNRTGINQAPDDILLFDFFPTVTAATGQGSDFVSINLSGAGPRDYPDVLPFLREAAAEFAADNAGGARLVSGGTVLLTSVSLADSFIDGVYGDLAGFFAEGGTAGTTVSERNIIRSGTGGIGIASSGAFDIRNGADVVTDTIGTTAYQLGGGAIYTVGHVADTGARTATVAGTNQTRVVDPAAYLAAAPTDTERARFNYGGSGQAALAGLQLADPVYAEGGGNISISAGGDVLGRRDVFGEARANANPATAPFTFIGQGNQAWRVGQTGTINNARVNPQLFTSGLGTLAGGSISVDAGGHVSDMSLVASGTFTTADVLADVGGEPLTQALVTYGAGNVEVVAAGDMLGGRLDVAHGRAELVIAGSIRTAGVLGAVTGGDITQNLLRVRLSDATVSFDVGGTVLLQGLAALGVNQTGNLLGATYNSFGFYSPRSRVGVVANGGIRVLDAGTAFTTFLVNEPTTAVYPGSVEMITLTGDLALNAQRGQPNSAQTINLFPSPVGQLRLLAGGDIAPLTLTMEDRDPGQLPGYFSSFTIEPGTGVTAGQVYNFPTVLPDTPTSRLAQLHNAAITHLNDREPIRIHAGGNIDTATLSLPKQARIGAGQDITDMVLFAQNLTGEDITRVVAGRDIIATTELERPVITPGVFGDPLPTLQGNTFVIGGPGAFFLEAGRDAGPFLNSAVVNPVRPSFTNRADIDVQGQISVGGGIISNGNDWNPFLPDEGADLNVFFGVGNGADFVALRETYLNPANVDALDDDLFVQVPDEAGNLLADRSQPIYGPILIEWMQANAAAVLQSEYGTSDVDYQQAYDAFLTLPELRQRSFLIGDLYFNELEATSRPDNPSYLQYSRGYRAVNTLFNPDLGYTANNLEGGSAGASETVETGNLDLRLATIQTTRGGDINLLGPGGRILAGSTVRTSEQAARRASVAATLLGGDSGLGFSGILTARILQIPTGSEGILSLRNGAVRSFTDTDLLLNQSRLFTQGGGNITLWSSNGDLNAGQGPKTAANFPPVVVRIDENGFSQVDAVGGVAGAGIAAFQPEVGVTPPDVYLIAPRGTVDAGDAGVRVAGNLFVAAAAVANSDNFQVGGSSIGVSASPVVDAGAVAASNAASAAAAQAATAATNQQAQDAGTQIYVDVQGFAGSEDRCDQNPRPADCPPEN